MGYAESDAMVRCDLFTERGKWKYTVALNMTGFYNVTFVHEAVEAALKEHYPGRYKGMWYVVLEPYHKDAYPQMGIVP